MKHCQAIIQNTLIKSNFTIKNTIKKYETENYDGALFEIFQTWRNI